MRKRRWAGLCALFVTISVAEPAVAQQRNDQRVLTNDERVGRTLFQTRCAMCHVGQEAAAEMAVVNSERRPAMGPTLSKANAKDETALRKKIKDGSVRMPGYKYTFSDAQVDQVIAFMKTLDQPLTRLFLSRPSE